MLGAMGLFACSAEGDVVPSPGPTTSVSADSGKQTPSESSSPSASETVPANDLRNYSSYQESPEYVALASELRAEIDRMDALSLDEYNLEKDSAQFAFAEFLTGVYKPYTMKMLEKYQQVPRDVRLNYDPSYFTQFESESLDSPIQEISDHAVLRTSIAVMSMTNGDGAVDPEAKERAIKMLSATFVKTDTSHPSNNHGSVYYGYVDYIDNAGETIDTDPASPGFEHLGFLLSGVRKESAVTTNPNFSNGPAKMKFFSQLTNSQDTAVSLVYVPLKTITGDPVQRWRIYEIGPEGGLGVNFTPIG